MRSGGGRGRGRRGRRRGRRRPYLGKVAHPPHPARDAGEEGRSLSQPGVVSSPLGESPSPPSWLFREWRAPSVRGGAARTGSALFHCLGTRKCRGRQFSPLPTGRGRRSSLPGASSAAVSTGEDAGRLLRELTRSALPPKSRSAAESAPGGGGSGRPPPAGSARIAPFYFGAPLPAGTGVVLAAKEGGLAPDQGLLFPSRGRQGSPLPPGAVAASPLPPPQLGCPRGWGFRTPRSARAAWAAGSGRPRLRTPVTGCRGAGASPSPVPAGPLARRVGLPALPPLGLRPVRAPREPEGGRTVPGLGSGSGSARLRCRPRLLPGLRAARPAPPPPPPAGPRRRLPRGLRRSGRLQAGAGLLPGTRPRLTARPERRPSLPASRRQDTSLRAARHPP